MEVRAQGLNPILKEKVGRWYADSFVDLDDDGYKFSIDLTQMEQK